MTEELQLFEHEETAIFLPREEIRKRYTGTQAAAIESKQTAALLLVAYGCPLEVIARELHLSTRTLGAWVSQQGSKVAGWRKEYADSLLQAGAKAFALADGKAQEASYLQLVTGGGILTDKAIALAAMGEVGEEKILKEGAGLAEAALAIRSRMEARRARQPAPSPHECQSGGQSHSINGLGDGEAPSEPQPPQPSPPPDPAPTPEPAPSQTPAGGAGTPEPPAGPMVQHFVDFPAKEPS